MILVISAACLIGLMCLLGWWLNRRIFGDYD